MRFARYPRPRFVRTSARHCHARDSCAKCEQDAAAILLDTRTRELMKMVSDIAMSSLGPRSFSSAFFNGDACLTVLDYRLCVVPLRRIGLRLAKDQGLNEGPLKKSPRTDMSLCPLKNFNTLLFGSSDIRLWFHFDGEAGRSSLELVCCMVILCRAISG